jgi:hypothetical protein
MIRRRPIPLITCPNCGSQRNPTEPRCLNGACPEHYPIRCYLCGLTIESLQDLDWHGIGNCVVHAGLDLGEKISPSEKGKKK